MTRPPEWENPMIKPTCIVAAAAIACVLCGAAGAQTWTPVGRGQIRTAEFARSVTFPVPASIAARGGVLRAVLVGGGEGGSLSRSSCDDEVVQGGKGGDGGEVVEVDIPLQPGMCPEGLLLQVGAGGRGALRAGNASASGESGTATTVGCAGALITQALGGGRRLDPVTAPKAARGGAGAVVMNVAEARTNETFDQRQYLVRPAADGQPGRQGLGAGGGGGGVAIVSQGFVSAGDGTTQRRVTLRNAPAARGGAGAGAGAGPSGFAAAAAVVQAENASHFGAGGGGAAALCSGAATGARDAGHGHGGVVRLQWTE